MTHLIHERLKYGSLLPSYFTAINYGKHSIDYQHFYMTSEYLAYKINNLNREHKKKIVIFGDRTPNIIYAIMGVLISGSGYSIIDVCHPIDRIKLYLDILRPDMCITCNYEIPKELTIYFSNIIRLPEDLNVIFNERRTELPHVEPNDTAVYTFTSGSTGMPKCVMGRHSSLTVFYPYLNEKLNMRSDLRYGMLSGISHDPLQRDIFTPIYFSATIYIPEQNILLDTNKISDWLIVNMVNVICVTPSMLQILVQSNKQFPSLTHIFTVGERLFKKDAKAILDLAYNATVINMYGSTETQRAVSMYFVRLEDFNKEPLKDLVIVPVGQGIGPVELLVLDKDNKQVKPGETGELYIRSKYISKGYLNNQKETEKSFIVNPVTNMYDDIVYKTGDLGKLLPCGNVVCLGREDNQVKIRGYRVELGEIDSCLVDICSKSITQIQNIDGNNMLITWINSTKSKHEIFDHIRSKLPHYMVPDDIVFVDKFYLTHTSKIDVSKLPIYINQSRKELHIHDMHDMHDMYDIHDIENRLIEYVKNNFNRAITRDDNLLELGLNSMGATQLVAHIKQTYKKVDTSKLNVMEFYRNPNIRGILDIIDRSTSTPYESSSSYSPSVDKKYFMDKISKYESCCKSTKKLKVLLTGATGFLGSHILKKLMLSDKIKKIIVFVRGDTVHEVDKKLSESLQLIGVEPQAINNIIRVPILWDAKVELSIYTQYIIGDIDIIIHNAAEVDWLKSYDQLEKSNVDFTAQLIKLAKLSRKIVKFTYISTTAVYDNDYHNSLTNIDPNDFPLDALNSIKGGYAQTKCVSECLIENAVETSFIFNIIRANYLVCDSEKYNWIDRDYLVKLLKHSIKTKLVPDNSDIYFYLLPVDIAATNIINTTLIDCNKITDLIGEKITLLDYLNLVPDSKVVSFNEWYDSIGEDSELFVLKDFIPKPNTFIKREYRDMTICGINDIITKFIMTL